MKLQGYTAVLNVVEFAAGFIPIFLYNNQVIYIVHLYYDDKWFSDLNFARCLLFPAFFQEQFYKVKKCSFFLTSDFLIFIHNLLDLLFNIFGTVPLLTSDLFIYACSGIACNCFVSAYAVRVSLVLSMNFRTCLETTWICSKDCLSQCVRSHCYQNNAKGTDFTVDCIFFLVLATSAIREK